MTSSSFGGFMDRSQGFSAENLPFLSLSLASQMVLGFTLRQQEKASFDESPWKLYELMTAECLFHQSPESGSFEQPQMTRAANWTAVIYDYLEGPENPLRTSLENLQKNALLSKMIEALSTKSLDSLLQEKCSLVERYSVTTWTKRSKENATPQAIPQMQDTAKVQGILDWDLHKCMTIDALLTRGKEKMSVKAWNELIDDIVNPPGSSAKDNLLFLRKGLTHLKEAKQLEPIVQILSQESFDWIRKKNLISITNYLAINHLSLLLKTDADWKPQGSQTS